MMHKLDGLLLRDEKILMQTKLHRVVFSYPVIWTAFTIVLYFIIPHDLIAMLLGGLCAILALFYWLQASLRYFTTRFTLTNKRLFVSSGFFQHHSLQVFLPKIEVIGVRQGVIAKMMGYGKIIIGTGGREHFFPQVANPIGLRNRVQIEVEKVIEAGFSQNVNTV